MQQSVVVKVRQTSHQVTKRIILHLINLSVDTEALTIIHVFGWKSGRIPVQKPTFLLCKRVQTIDSSL